MTTQPRLFTKPRIIAAVSLLVVVIACFAGALITRDAMAFLPVLKAQKQNIAEGTVVDLRPWQTAEELAAMAVTAEEQSYARQAEHLAEHEVDQAFGSALRQAQMRVQHSSLKGNALALSQKVSQLQKLVSDDQARVQSLTASANSPSASNDDLDYAKAQLGVDSDELADAQQDLARALGDERSRIQQELAAHQAAVKKYDSESASKSLGAVATASGYGTLARRLKAWFNQRTRYQLLLDAARQSDSDTQTLTTQHNAMEKQKVAPIDSSADKVTRLNAMKSRSVHSQMLSIYDDRIQSQSQLADVYRRWAAQVLIQHRIVFHLLMQSFALLAFVLLCALISDIALRHLFDRPAMERRMYTFRLISRLSLQLIAAAIILLLIFGPPSEMPTILGLTTAGLTVVLQDFIISFCGWFVLMGKHGIRIGDWVEIDGVGGEVAEIGLFRTALLETGNWTDHGHPTGRRVTFSNSFAIKGQYFNFTTSGQWMWDEITVTVPNSADAYGTIELIHKAVLEETEKESDLAEEEWRRAAQSNDLSKVGAAAAVNMRPSAGGVDIVVRYVTRASTRYSVRNLIYQRVIELLHKPLAIVQNG